MKRRLEIEECAAVIVDVQERLLPVISGQEHLVARLQALIGGLLSLDVPMTYTEQYPKGLGRTVSTIDSLLEEIDPIEKLSFSCYGADSFREWVREADCQAMIIAGIETHVCVLQTSLDLIEDGITPVIVTDAVSSRHEHDSATALTRLASAGAILTTTESILFELLEEAGTDTFKRISAIVKEL